MKKRGQFYLVAAIIIVSLIIGLAAVSNYLKREESVKLQDFGKELEIESRNVLDYGLYKNENIKDLLLNFAKNYSEYIEDKNIYFIFGDSNEITIIGYQITEEEAFIETAQLPIGEAYSFMPIGDIITVKIKGIEYKLEIKKGQNFYFIITQEIEGEYYVVTNQ